jgi:hypothetical protein
MHEDKLMDVPKPKSWPAWRVVLTDFVIVVLGVGVALAAQQAADWLHWRSQYQQARESLAGELANNASRGAFRVVIFACTEAKLDKAAAILDEATRTGTLPPVSGIGFPQPFVWPSGAWDSVIGAQVAAYFPRAQLAQLSLLYEAIRAVNESSKQEEVAWAELGAMVGPGRRFDPALDVALHAALSRARMYNTKIAVNGGQIEQRAFELDLPFSPADRKLVTDRIDRARDCLPPIGGVPAHYGTSVYNRSEPIIQEWLKKPLYGGKAPP